MGMANVQTPYEQDMREAVEQITEKMSGMDCTTDGVQLFVNHWGMWCAKYKTRQSVVYFAFAMNPLGALQNLRDNPEQEQSVYGRE